MPFDAGRRDALVRDVAWCAGWILLSRAVLLAVGVSARSVMRDKLGFDYVWTYADAVWLDIWGVWDTGWYLDILRNGYDAAPHAGGPTAGQANWAFFPLYPMLGRGLAALTGLGGFPALLVIAHAAFVAAVGLLFAETRARFGRPAARAAVAVLCVMPGSYVFSSGYTESLFLALILLAFALARREHWLAAGAAGFAAALTRNLGVLLVIPFLLCGWPWLRAAIPAWRPSVAGLGSLLADPAARRVLAALVLPPLGTVAYMLGLWGVAGDPLAFLRIQNAWQRELGNPLASLLAPLVEPGALTARAAANWAAAWVGIGLCAVLVWWRRWALAAFGAALLLVPLAAGLESVLRYTTVVFPAVMAAGALLGPRPPALAAVLAALAAFNGFLMACWAVGLPNVI